MRRLARMVPLALAVSACSPMPTPGLRPPDVGHGSVEVGIRWPSYATQAIPYSSAALDLTLEQDAATVATASIVRPAGHGTLDRVKAGRYVLVAQARRSDATRTVVAEASVSVEVHANRVATARLTLVPRFTPLLSSLSPTQGPPGTAVTLWGAFGTSTYPISKASYSVTLDGVPVPADPYNSSITIWIPEGVGPTCSIAVSVDGVSIPSSQAQEFTVVPAETPEP